MPGLFAHGPLLVKRSSDKFVRFLNQCIQGNNAFLLPSQTPFKCLYYRPWCNRKCSSFKQPPDRAYGFSTDFQLSKHFSSVIAKAALKSEFRTPRTPPLIIKAGSSTLGHLVCNLRTLMITLYPDTNTALKMTFLFCLLPRIQKYINSTFFVQKYTLEAAKQRGFSPQRAMEQKLQKTKCT